MLEWGTRVNTCPNGEPESMHDPMWGGLLQDTVSPMGDMVHYKFGHCNSHSTYETKL
jgi:hypothetical protein